MPKAVKLAPDMIETHPLPAAATAENACKCRRLMLQAIGLWAPSCGSISFLRGTNSIFDD